MADQKTKRQTVATRISDFLSANPEGPLKIATGYASFFGLSWIAGKTEERESVDILIGDCGAQHFLKAGLDEVATVLDFIERDNVNLWELERGNKSRVHSKVWVADLCVLAGSANLTKNGLYKNSEIMGIFSGADRYRAFKQVHELLAAADPADMIISAYSECIMERGGGM